jgi:hypothetical protein
MLGFDSPEHAAMDGFPTECCRVVASRVDGDNAYVLLDTGSPGQPYLYGVNCKRSNGQWFEGASGNGGGWSLTDVTARVGTWSLWGDAPADVDRVRASFNGELFEEPVLQGAYLFVWWRQPESLGEAPAVTEVRISGKWIERPDWGSFLSSKAGR